MMLHATLDALARKLKLRHYRAVRAEYEGLSEADLADMGIKRYQLGSAARQRAFK